MNDELSTLGEDAVKKFLAKKEELIISDDVRYILNFKYSEYYGLKRVYLGKNVIDISNGAFYDCQNLEDIVLGTNKRFTFKDGFLIQKSKKRLALCLVAPSVPDGVEIINMTCFLKPNRVENFYIGKSLKNIDRAMRKFSIGNIVLDPENKYFELESSCLFYKGSNNLILGCETSIIPPRTELICSEAFCSCNIKEIVIPSKVKDIESHAFGNCSNLSRVTFIEGDLKRIESMVFRNCNKLTEIEFPASLQIYYTDAFPKKTKISQRKL